MASWLEEHEHRSSVGGLCYRGKIKGVRTLCRWWVTAAQIGATVLDETTGELVRHRTETVYDILGRTATSRTNIRVVVDEQGQVVSTDYVNVQETHYEYDSSGRRVETIYDDASYVTRLAVRRCSRRLAAGLASLCRPSSSAAGRETGRS